MQNTPLLSKYTRTHTHTHTHTHTEAIKSGRLFIHCCWTASLEQPTSPHTHRFSTYSLGILLATENAPVLLSTTSPSDSCFQNASIGYTLHHNTLSLKLTKLSKELIIITTTTIIVNVNVNVNMRFIVPPPLLKEHAIMLLC